MLENEIADVMPGQYSSFLPGSIRARQIPYGSSLLNFENQI